MQDNIENLHKCDRSLIQKLINLLQLLRDSKRGEFDRVLPVGEHLSDRWEKAQYLGFGKGASIYDSSYVYGDVKVGENSWVGPFTILDGSAGSLVIGSNTHVCAGVQIYTHDTVGIATKAGSLRKGNVIIGNNCYIGPNVVISLGVTIGDHAVIGANSFVNSDVPAHHKAFGTPVRISAQEPDPSQ